AGQPEIATHEQRFSPNLKSVLSADTFGEQSENNVGEFLKMMPGIEIAYVGPDARNAIIRGMPADQTIVTANGNQLASATSGQTGRNFEFEQISINDVERVEVNKTLLPNQPAEGIGGTINLVFKTSFARSRPDFRYRAYFNFNNTLADLKKTPGPLNKESRKVVPGFDFTYINPLTRDFGVTLTGAYSKKYTPSAWATRLWTADPATPTGGPRGTAGSGGANPYWRQAAFFDTLQPTERTSGRIAFDWRFAPHDVISVGFFEAYYYAGLATRRLNILTQNNTTTPADWSRDFTQGRPQQGRAGFTNSFNEKSGTTWTPDFKYVHNGPVWRFESGGAYSHATSNYLDFPKAPRFSFGTAEVGSINPLGTTAATRFQAPTIRFDHTGNHLPTISATLANGTAVNARDANNGIITNAGTLLRDAFDVKKTFRLNATREIEIGIPLTLRVGGDFRNAIRDIKNQNRTWTFVGPDGIDNTLDDRASLYDVIDDYHSFGNISYGTAPYNFLSVYKLYDLFVRNPRWFSPQSAEADAVDRVANSRHLDEKVTSGFVRLDGALFRNRIHFAGGVRYESYKSRSESPLTNNLGRFLTDADGDLILGPDGRPVVGNFSAEELSRRTNVERGGTRVGALKDYYPSLTVRYDLTAHFQVSAGYSESVGYPDLSVLTVGASATLPTVAQPRFTTNSPVDPWTSKNYDIDLSYYTPSGGSFTLALYRRDITNFIATIVHDPFTPGAKAELEAAGYGSLYDLGYEVFGRRNLDVTARAEGWEFALRQPLDAYVPDRARGITVFFNTSYNSAVKTAASAA
ncbi:MAG: hypothetical protein FJ399_16580, partial [Verrucomicrobia bacterium]|nr:hypothetical protein [Verrucomicrobiota bacterium]